MNLSSPVNNKPHCLGTALLAACLLLLVGLTGCEDTKIHLREGKIMAGNGRYQEAIELFAKTFEAFPRAAKTHAEARELIRATYLRWAQELYNNKSFGDAAQVCRDLMTAYPDTSEARQAQVLRIRSLVGYGGNLAEYRLPADAAKVFHQVLAEAPDSPHARTAREFLDSLGHLVFEAVHDGQAGLWRYNADGSAFRFITEGCQGALSPRGDQLLFIRKADRGKKTGTLHRLDLSTGEEETVFSIDVCCRPHWFSDGRRYLISKLSRPNLFQICDLDGHKDSYYNRGFEQAGKPAFEILGPPSPDGESILAWPLDKREEYPLSLVNTQFNAFSVLFSLPDPIHQARWLSPKGDFLVVTAQGVYTAQAPGGGTPRLLWGSAATGLEFRAAAAAPNGVHTALLARPVETEEGGWRIYLADRNDQLHELALPTENFQLGTGTLEWRKGYLE
jgi:tetratricopeptide (TPR) repeat protein